MVVADFELVRHNTAPDFPGTIRHPVRTLTVLERRLDNNLGLGFRSLQAPGIGTRGSAVIQGVGEFLTPAEAARFLGVSVQMVRLYVKAGKLSKPGRTPGGHSRYKISELKALQDSSQP